MSWSDVPPEMRERLSQMYEHGMPLFEAADEYGLTMPNLRRRIQEYRTYKKQLEFARTFTIPLSPTPRYTDYKMAEGDNWLIMSDVELPDHDEEMIEAVIRTGIRFGIDRLIIAGDLIATDQAALNSWPITWADGTEMAFSEVRKMAERLLSQLSKQFKDIYFITGNHDQRVGKATRGHVHLEMLLDRTEIEYSHYPYMFVDTSRGPIYVAHPYDGRTTNPFSLGMKLYANTSTPDGLKPHVVFGHTHQMGFFYCPDGLKREIHSLGCIRNEERTKYKMMATNSYAHWTPGFLMIKDGFFHPLPKWGTNWTELLGENSLKTS